VVRFDRIPRYLAIGLLVERTGVSEDDALAVLAAAGGVLSRAVGLVGSSSRMAARDGILLALKDLTVMDGCDVLAAVREFMIAVKAPLDDLRQAQEEELAGHRDLMGRKGGSTKPLEERHKRELTAREREGLHEILNVTESWLRDCLAISRGAAETVYNKDQADAMTEVGMVLSAGAAVKALASVAETRRRISYNVSPQLALEAMLFDIREVLRCPR
jgi:DNA polymerase-3 subunit delta'